MMRFLLFLVCGFTEFYFNCVMCKGVVRIRVFSFLLLKTFRSDLVIFRLGLFDVCPCIAFREI